MSGCGLGQESPQCDLSSRTALAETCTSLVHHKHFRFFSLNLGRIKQLLELDYLNPGSIRLFILDEADKLLEEGSFQEQIK